MSSAVVHDAQYRGKHNQRSVSPPYQDGKYEVFARSPGGIMYRKTWNGSWSAWASIGGNFA